MVCVKKRKAVPSAFFFYLLSFRVLLYFIVSSDII